MDCNTDVGKENQTLLFNLARRDPVEMKLANCENRGKIFLD